MTNFSADSGLILYGNKLGGSGMKSEDGQRATIFALWFIIHTSCRGKDSLRNLVSIGILKAVEAGWESAMEGVHVQKDKGKVVLVFFF